MSITIITLLESIDEANLVKGSLPWCNKVVVVFANVSLLRHKLKHSVCFRLMLDI